MEETIPEITEDELEETYGGQAAAAPCASTPDGVCICG